MDAKQGRSPATGGPSRAGRRSLVLGFRWRNPAVFLYLSYVIALLTFL